MQSPSELGVSLLTPQVERYILGMGWPSGLQIGLSWNYDLHYIQFILYRDNFITFSGEEHMRITALVKEMMDKLRTDNIPIFLEIKPTRGVTSAR